MNKDRVEIKKIMGKMWNGLRNLYLTGSDSSPPEDCLDELAEYVRKARTETADKMKKACKQIVRDANET